MMLYHHDHHLQVATSHIMSGFGSISYAVVLCS